MIHWGERRIGYANPIELTYLAGGSCPELYGTVKALKDTGLDNDIHAEIYDIEDGWRNLQNITLDLCKEYYGENISMNFFSGYDVRNSSNQNLKNGHGILVMQNYLSHVRDAEKFMQSFESLLNSNRFGTIIILDLNYGATNYIFERICDKDFRKQHILFQILKHIPSDGEPIAVTHARPSFGIQKIFDSNINGLKPRY